jgi:hypothetical protein
MLIPLGVLNHWNLTMPKSKRLLLFLRAAGSSIFIGAALYAQNVTLISMAILGSLLGLLALLK